MLIQRMSALLLSVLVLAAAPAWAADDHAVDAEHQVEHAGEHGEHGGHGHHELGHGDADIEALENPADFRSDLAIFTFVVFILLMLILLKFAWGPISAALDKREQTITGQLAAAEQKHEEAKQLLANYEKKLAGAADQVRELLEEARRDAEHTKSEILAEAKAAAQAEHERAMRDVHNATDAALKQIAELSAGLAVDLAGRIVQQKITPDEQSRLVREALAKLPSGQPSRN